MHEFGITSRIVDTVLRAVGEQDAAAVVRVDLLVGQLTFLDPRQVAVAYAILTRGTPLENSKLSIDEGKGLVRCQNCQQTNEIEVPHQEEHDSLQPALPLLVCPNCGGGLTVIGGRECLIRGIALRE